MTHEIETPEQLAALLGEDWTFSAQQWAAVTAPLEPAVVIAGAGSGKTTVMAARVVWLVATGRVAPGEILGLTFTTKATAELQGRIRDNLRRAGLLPERTSRVGDDEDEVEEPTVATYHSYASALLSEHGLRIGHEPDTRLIADASRYQLAARAVQRYAAPVEQLTDSPRHVVQYLLALDAEMSEHLVEPATVREYDARERPRFVEGMATEHRKTYRARNEKAIAAIDKRAELLGLVEAYRALKAHLGLMDFSDQIALAARLAERCPEVGELERSKFKVVLLDEYQDTSVAQALMLSRLFSGPDPEHGLGHPVTAVGDPNQAIYGWRGASVSNILEFAASFPGADGRASTYPLTVNRRSDARILATANHLAAELYEGRPELLPLEAKPGARDGEVTAIVHETYDDELAWLADRVIATHAEMAEPAWREIGVLTRDNSHAAAVFDALSDREIPVEIVGLKGLLRLPEVSEVVATLTLVQDVTANAALLTLLAGPRWAIGPRDLALLGRRARELAGSQQGGESFADVQAQLRAAVEGADPTEIASLCDALEDPGDHDYSARGPRALRPAGRGAAPAARCHRRADPRPGPPDRRHHRHRRRAGLLGLARRGRPARQPRPVRAGGRGVPGGRRPGHPGRPAGLARGRGRVRPGPRRRHPVRGRLGQAAHRPPGQGPGVGRGLPGRRDRAEVPVQPQPVELADGAVRDAVGAARRRPRPARADRAHARRHRRARHRRQGARGRGGAAPGVRRLDPRPAPAVGVRVVLGLPPQDRPRPLAVPPGHPRGDGVLGR